jgi:hypothetical protein
MYVAVIGAFLLCKLFIARAVIACLAVVRQEVAYDRKALRQEEV